MDIPMADGSGWDRLVPRRRRWNVVESLCRRIDARLAVELGVLRGTTLRHLLSSLPDLHVIAVDTWAHGYPEFEPDRAAKKTADDSGYRAYADVDMEEAYAGVLQIARDFVPRCHVWRMDMLRAAESVERQSVDLVFHDADHTTTGLMTAIRAWLPALRPGGIVAGHDYDMPSVRLALTGLCPTFRAEHDSTWWIPIEEVRA